MKKKPTAIIMSLLLPLWCVASTNIIESCYLDNEGGHSRLKELLEEWATESTSHEEPYEHWEAEAYAIFEHFFSPANLTELAEEHCFPKVLREYYSSPDCPDDQKLSPNQIEKKIEANKKYVMFSESPFILIQNNLNVIIIEKKRTTPDRYNPSKEVVITKKKELRIDDFQPTMNLPWGKVIVLSDENKSILQSFLGKPSWGAHKNDSISEQKKLESQKRGDFLSALLPIHHNHWAGWRLVTPYVSRIIFDSTNLTKASVYFSLGYTGNVAMYSKIDDQWILESIKGLSIE